jgi:DENN domain-containing protein 11/Domain of unknown function (DUF4484)
MAENGHLRIDTSLGDGPQRPQRPPPVAAAFCVIFDARKGYTLAWREAIEGLDIDGIVEYKSLPSGLHTVKEDLVYFVHENYAGISAFLNKESEQDARGARMLATGVLVPIQDSRMGQAWLHAEGLKELVGKQIGNPEDISLLEEYWDEFKMKDESKDAAVSTDDLFDARAVKQPNGYQKTRAMSDAMAAPSQGLSLHHPAKALPVLFKAFGPLVFPLYRAALLRKRILLVGEAPVDINCNFVYAISLLSSIQRVLLPLLPVDDVPDMRLRPLFNVGIQDIPLLQRSKDSESGIQDGWVACTTDDILATKPELFDILVILPPPHSKNATTKVYPKIIPSSPDLSRKTRKTTTRATQRDARRFISLRAYLRQFVAETSQPPEEAAIDAETQSVSSAAESALSRASIIELQSWSHIAYTSLLWWASAGEKRSGPDEDEDEEADHDAHLLGDDDDSSSAELTIVSYFHRLTNTIFGNISNAIAKADGDELWERAGIDAEDDDAESEEDEAAAVTDGETNEDQALLSNKANDSVVEITHEDLMSMGLDIWSSSDRIFVEDLVRTWWGREAAAKGSRIECCGIRIL